MNFLVIGSGGREHAIFWRLRNDGSAKNVYCAPGNGGIPAEYRIDIAQDDYPSIAAFCKDKKIDAAIVGPEAPLAGGIVDYLQEQGIKAFGPSKKAAMLEGSKLFAKEIMDRYGIPTAYHHSFNGKEELLEYIKICPSWPIVIKLDGLAAGKGVGIPENYDEALEFIESNVSSDTKVFVEDYLDGEEASILGISDGKTVKCFIAAQDHKRAFDGDTGPNTGGMGAYAPAPVVTQQIMEKASRGILQKTVDAMNSEGIPFKGVLYAGLMISGEDIRVLEFNARFGDPETQVILPLLKGKLGDIIMASIEGKMDEIMIESNGLHALTVVIASGGYPGSYEKGIEISGISEAEAEGATVFHAGTSEKDGRTLTAGGRVLNVTATGTTLDEARRKVYSAVSRISFRDSFYRKDIAHRAMNR